MNEMIERIARLWLQKPTGKMEDNFPLKMRFDTLDQFLNCIRASIEAMREPTEGMLWAAYQADAGAEKTFEDFITLCPGWRADQTAIWRAMVGATLAEPAKAERERGGVGS